MSIRGKMLEEDDRIQNDESNTVQNNSMNCLLFIIISSNTKGEENDDLISITTDENGMNVGCADFRRHDGVNGIIMIVW